MKKKAYKNEKEEETFWPSFVDVMTTISLVFFIIMIIAISITYIRNKQISSTYNKVLSEKKQLLRKYKTIKVTSQMIDDIAGKRMKIYEDLERELKPQLGNNIEFDKEKGRFDIKTEVLFPVSKYELTKQGKGIAHSISEAFYNFFENSKLAKNIESIEVRGHTDNRLNGEYNRFLSTNRAASFINQMIPNNSKYEKYAKYFKASGMSKYEPKFGTVASQNNNDMAQNRRIEIYIKLKDKDIENAIKKLVNSKEFIEEVGEK